MLLDPITRGWAVVAAGSAARLALGFVASVLVARALGPAAFGTYAVLAAASNLVGALADFGLSDAAVRRIAPAWPTEPTTARVRGQVFFWLRVGLAALVATVGILISGPLSREVFGLPADGTLLALALLGVVATAASGAASSLLQATGRFGRITLVMLANSGLTALLAAALVLGGQLNLLTALLLLGIGTSLASFAVGRRLLPNPLSLALPSHRAFQVEGPPLIEFGRWLWLSSLFAMLAAQLDLLLVNRWCDPAIVGAYGLALNLATKVDVVNQSLYTVLLPAASALQGEGSVSRYVRRGLVRSALLSVALLPLFILAKPFVELFYGSAYTGAVGLFQLLLGIVILDIVTSPLLLLAFTYNRPKLLAGADALRAGTLAGFGIALVPAFGPVGAVAARLAGKVVGAAFILAGLRDARRAGAYPPSPGPHPMDRPEGRSAPLPGGEGTA